MNRKPLYFFAGLILLMVVYVYFAQKEGKKRDHQYFMEFDNAQLNGKLVDVRVAHHASAFKVAGIEKEFWFVPDIDEDGQYEFSHFAEPGDSVIKPRHSDTLTLIKKGNEYYYTFMKF